MRRKKREFANKSVQLVLADNRQLAEEVFKGIENIKEELGEITA